MRMFGLLKVPLVAFVRPKVVSIDDDSVEMEVRLNRQTRDQTGSLSFGALCIGASSTASYLALRHILIHQLPVEFSFKQMNSKFFKRSEGNVRFFCSQGEEITRSLREAVRSGDRVNVPMIVTATVPSVSDSEAVAEFELLLSLKRTRNT